MKKHRTTEALRLSRDVLRVLAGAELSQARGAFIPDPTTAATDGDTGCQSEATGCHTGLSGCGSC